MLNSDDPAHFCIMSSKIIKLRAYNCIYNENNSDHINNGDHINGEEDVHNSYIHNFLSNPIIFQQHSAAVPFQKGSKQTSEDTLGV